MAEEIGTKIMRQHDDKMLKATAHCSRFWLDILEVFKYRILFVGDTN